jgi:hypothetical protein
MVMAAACVAADATARPDNPNPNELFTFNVGDDVEVFQSERFAIHYTQAGVHAVDVQDSDDNQVPDIVEEIAALYEEVALSYQGLGFEPPDGDNSNPQNGGDDRFDVYLVDFNFNADGAFVREQCNVTNGVERCNGYMVQENDFQGYGYPSQRIGHRTVASHEYFHAVQAHYDASQDAVFNEGTAVWATEQFDPPLTDFERLAAGYQDNADTPLTGGGGGPVDSFSYGASMFFQSLSERHGTDVILHLLERTQSTPWIEVVGDVLADDVNESFADAWMVFSQWSMMTGTRSLSGYGFANALRLPERSAENNDWPFVPTSFPVFVASSRVVRVAVPSTSELVVSLTGTPAQVDGLRVVALPANGNQAPVELAPGIPTDVVGGPHLVMFINTRIDGPAARAQICVGSEVDCAPPVVDDEEPPPPEPEPTCQQVPSSSLRWFAVVLLCMRQRTRQRSST